MSEWTVIDYWQYWDVPREFVVRHGEEAYFFESPFDEGLDDYTPNFYVYRLPLATAESAAAHWGEFKRFGEHLPDIPVSQLRFRTESIHGESPTRRYLRFIHNSVFEILLRHETKS